MPGSRREEKTSSLGAVFQAVFLSTLILDQITKFFALRFLADVDSLPVISGIFHLTLVHNTGIAFGFFRQHPGLLLILITLSLFFLFWWGWRQPDLPRLQRLALAMILGGAVGNWIDRVRFGAVIDFLDFRVWPVFNLADSAITIGVSIFLLLILLKRTS
jgi:signal peptidase II